MTDFGEIKTAIAGLGVIGSVHARILEENGCSPVAVCDLCAEKCEPYSYAEKYTDYARMLDECKPNIVHICTPHYLHADMIIEALNRNINVLCEKPLCISRDEITRILAAEKKSKAILGVCHQNRYNAENRFVKDYIKDKKIVCATANVVWRRDEAYYRSAEWRGRRDTEGGGVLINQALHTLDLMQWFAGFSRARYGKRFEPHSSRYYRGGRHGVCGVFGRRGFHVFRNQRQPRGFRRGTYAQNERRLRKGNARQSAR